ncbi:hypothetical protein PsYK624_101380 [Phanerochaete sordida]|uniref:Uncharacterized protein n=1 Tax=Phanerochaete sordida TaxID=48140 RepID=A0A9P3LFX2_9APHY|nr:hypothetical protein PsYK624_101380 [Phanerochaete sordida]
MARWHLDLPPAAIALLLGLTDDGMLWLASHMRGVLFVDTTGRPAPLHTTFAAFLVDGARCVDPLYHAARREEHALLAFRCPQAFNDETATAHFGSCAAALTGSDVSTDARALSLSRAYLADTSRGACWRHRLS